MHFYYIDESGDSGTNLEDAGQPIFVLGGISVRDEGWNKTHEMFEKTIAGYFEPDRIPANFELHANDLLGPYGAGAFAGHDAERRYGLCTSILDMLAERHHKVHFYAVDKTKMQHSNPEIGLEFDAKVPYLVAFDYLITYINKDIQKNLGQSARGMIFLDEKSNSGLTWKKS